MRAPLALDPGSAAVHGASSSTSSLPLSPSLGAVGRLAPHRAERVAPMTRFGANPSGANVGRGGSGRLTKHRVEEEGDLNIDMQELD